MGMDWLATQRQRKYTGFIYLFGDDAAWDLMRVLLYQVVATNCLPTPPLRNVQPATGIRTHTIDFGR